MMMMILMKPPNNGDKAPTDHLLLPNKEFNTRVKITSVEILDKGVSLKYPKAQDVAKALGCSPQNDSKGPLKQTIPKQLNEQEKVQLVPT